MCFLLYTELHPICLLRKTSNISRRISRPAMDIVLSSQTHIWPYSSLYFLPNSRASSQLQGFSLLLLWLKETMSFFILHTAFYASLCFLLLARPVFVCPLPHQFSTQKRVGENQVCLGITCSFGPGEGEMLQMQLGYACSGRDVQEVAAV